MTTTAGVLIGIPTLRLRGAYVGIVTLAFGEVIGQVAANGQDIRLFGGTLTDGPNGITPIDSHRPPVPGAVRPAGSAPLVLVRARARRPDAARHDPAARLASGPRVDRGARRRAGGGERGGPDRGDEAPAYGIGAAFGGVTGAFLASYLRTVNPAQFTFSFSIFILVMVVLGGLGSIWGVVLGAIAVAEINSVLLPRVLNDAPSALGLDFDLSSVASGVYGLLLILVVLLRPEGLLPERRTARRVR